MFDHNYPLNEVHEATLYLAFKNATLLEGAIIL